MPLTPLDEACLQMDLMAIHEIVEDLAYKDDEGAATEVIANVLISFNDAKRNYFLIRFMLQKQIILRSCKNLCINIICNMDMNHDLPNGLRSSKFVASHERCSTQGAQRRDTSTSHISNMAHCFLLTSFRAFRIGEGNEAQIALKEGSVLEEKKNVTS
ncbi:hypothetical protein OSB04_022636 [Centaurea solstitialis]|uniref:Uncharacterized protein n=1 Tax=Centaurea solstitialis TaxID=347529 RepID=A0AA38SWS2_9ASTR|nr:hypothetical protein OSB04_022636 [Centaurea solstitialis]